MPIKSVSPALSLQKEKKKKRGAKELTQPGKPFIAVTINYRLSTWGFLSSHEVAESGNTNLGLRDQRLALHWIRENIASFGGDPDKVTIWGESAGAMSVGYHLTAYGGRDDRLFRGGIMESGGSISASALGDETSYQDEFDALVKEIGCEGSGKGALQCLREVPFEELNGALNGTGGSPAYGFSPVIDGDFIRKRGSVSLNDHEFVQVPVIAGTNSDEGTSFGPTGINTTDQFYDYLTGMSLHYQLALNMYMLTAQATNPTLPSPPPSPKTSYPSTPMTRRKASQRTSAMPASPQRACNGAAQTPTPATT